MATQWQRMTWMQLAHLPNSKCIRVVLNVPKVLVVVSVAVRVAAIVAPVEQQEVNAGLQQPHSVRVDRVVV